MDIAFYSLHKEDYDACGKSLHDVGLLYLDQPMTGVRFPEFSRTRYPTTRNQAVSAVVRTAVLPNAGLALTRAVTLLPATSEYPNDNVTIRMTYGGDSGGPLFLEGTHTLVGTETRFDPTNQLDSWARLDSDVHDFLVSRVHAHRSPPAVGGADSAEGAVDAEIASNRKRSVR